MKSEIRGHQKVIKYPCLMFRNGYVILMTDEHTGTIVYTDEPDNFPLGYYSNSFAHHTEKLFEGTVILRN